MKNTILKKFFSSGIQAIAVQVIGIFFFYFISLYFSKENFGLISWANALCMFVTTLLSCGIEQVVVRRIAVSGTSNWAAAAYLLHSLAGSLIVFIIILALHFIFYNTLQHYYFPLFFIAQGIVYITSPLKQFLNAKEKFTPYGVIAIVSNVGKIVAAFFLKVNGELSIRNIVLILIFFAFFELVCLFTYILSNSDLNFTFKFKLNAYKKLLKESTPQYIAVIFDSSLSRMDWILLGFISTTVITADYSFAYRAFEITRLPLTIIAPVILPLFARLLNQSTKFDPEKKALVKDVFVIEMFFATGIFLITNILWTPLISQITHGTYGESNWLQFFILSLCIPLHFFINLLWTICFGGKKYRIISAITIFSAFSNVILNLALIPFYGGVGAAIAFLVTSILQGAAYFVVVKREFVSFPVVKLILFYLISITIFYLVGFLVGDTVLRLLYSVILYVVFCIVLRQIGRKQLIAIKLLLSR